MSKKSPILIPLATVASIIGTLGMGVPAVAAEEVWTSADMVEYQTEALRIFAEQCEGSEDEKACRSKYYSDVMSYDMMMGAGVNNPKLRAYLDSIDYMITMTAYSPTNNTMNFYTDYENMYQRLLGETNPAVYSNIPEEFYLVWVNNSLASTYAKNNNLGGGRIAVKYADEIRAGHSLPSGIEVLYAGSKDQPNWITPGKEFQIVSDKFQSLYKRADGKFYLFYSSEQRDLSYGFNFSSCLTWPGYADGMDCVDVHTSSGNSGIWPMDPAAEYRLAVKPGYVDLGAPVEPEEPEKPTEPEEPESPTEPENPMEPEKPESPEIPEDPFEPETPDAPDAPAKPDAPTKPEDLTKPAELNTLVELNVPAELAQRPIGLATSIRSVAVSPQEMTGSPKSSANEDEKVSTSLDQALDETADVAPQASPKLEERALEASVPATNGDEANFPWPLILVGFLGVGLALWWLVPTWRKKDAE